MTQSFSTLFQRLSAQLLKRKGMRAGRLASFGLLAILVVLPGYALWGATATYRMGVAVRHSTELSNIFERARYGIGAEESLERKYRLEPGEDVREKHKTVSIQIIQALEHAALRGDEADRRSIANVLDRHAQYLAAIQSLFAAVDAKDDVAAHAIDENEVDPVFDEIEAAVVALSDSHRTDAANRLQALTTIQTRVLIATPVVFAFGAFFAVFFWRLLRAYQQSAQQGLAREASSIRLSEQRFRGLVQNASDLILICSKIGKVTYQSPSAAAKWSYADTALPGEALSNMVHPDDKSALRELLKQVRQAPGAGEGTTRNTELRLRDGAGEWRHTELIATNRLHDPAIQGLVVTARDVTERKAFEQQLTQRAFYDELTGLPNRVLFRDRLDQALVRAGRRNDRVGLLFLDLDNFKLVNDSLGHHIGDQLLIEAANRLQSSIRSQDTVARLGGDEFVVILELITNDTDAVGVAKLLSERFSQPFDLDGRAVVVTASIGIAISETGRGHAETLLRDADVAMYRAKSDGRAHYILFTPSMQTDTLARLELENDLRRALEHNELRVYYQPIVQLESGDFLEVEALVRWEHPTRGLMTPGDFIPLAEETGLIIPLGQWVLEQACHQVALWNTQAPAKPPLTVSVNLSPRQFQTPTLLDDVKRALAAARLPAKCLKLEITEGVIMRDVETTIQTLWSLKELGIQLAVDDFGTGYSSLSYLKRLPIDVLKIDRSFVSGIGHSQEDKSIVHAIMALAKSLNLEVTGEGIETAEQAALLGKWGCDRGQGYLFSRPLNSQSAGALLGRNPTKPAISRALKHAAPAEA